MHTKGAQVAGQEPCSDKELREATPPEVQHPVLGLPSNQGMPAGSEHLSLGGRHLATTAGARSSRGCTAPTPDPHAALSGSLLLGSCLGHLHAQPRRLHAPPKRIPKHKGCSNGQML